MQEVEKSVQDIAKGMGLDHEYVLNKLKCVADSSSDDGIVLQSTKELAKIIGTSGTTIKQKEMGIKNPYLLIKLLIEFQYFQQD